MIRFSCSRCHAALKAREGGAGRKVSCPRCRQRVDIPPPDTKTSPANSRPGPSIPSVVIPYFSENSDSSVVEPTRLVCSRCGRFMFVEQRAPSAWTLCDQCSTILGPQAAPRPPGEYPDHDVRPRVIEQRARCARPRRRPQRGGYQRAASVGVLNIAAERAQECA